MAHRLKLIPKMWGGGKAKKRKIKKGEESTTITAPPRTVSHTTTQPKIYSDLSNPYQGETIQRGMTLSDIAAIYRISLEELLKNNPEIEDPNNVPIGTRIRVPEKVFSLVPSHYTTLDSDNVWYNADTNEFYEEWADGQPYYGSPSYIDRDENGMFYTVYLPEGEDIWHDYISLDKPIPEQYIRRGELTEYPYYTRGNPLGEVRVLPDGRVFVPAYMNMTNLDVSTRNHKAYDKMLTRMDAAQASDAVKLYLKEKYPDLSKLEIKDICSGVEKHFMDGGWFSIDDSGDILNYLDNNEIIKNYIYNGGEIAEVNVGPSPYMPINQTYDFRLGDIHLTVSDAMTFGAGIGGIGMRNNDGDIEWILFMNVNGWVPNYPQANDTSIVSRVFEKGDLGGHYVTYTPGQPGYNERRDIVNTNLSTRTWPVVVIDNNTGKVGTEHR